MNARKGAAIAALTLTTLTGALATGASAQAADAGAWSNGCISGKICFYTGNVGTTALSSATRDSDFRDNFLAGRTLDEGAKTWKNNFTGSGKVQVFTGTTYKAGTQSSCLGKGSVVGPYSILSSHSDSSGVSSFKSC